MQTSKIAANYTRERARCNLVKINCQLTLQPTGLLSQSRERLYWFLPKHTWLGDPASILRFNNLFSILCFLLPYPKSPNIGTIARHSRRKQRTKQCDLFTFAVLREAIFVNAAQLRFCIKIKARGIVIGNHVSVWEYEPIIAALTAAGTDTIPFVLPFPGNIPSTFK